MKLEQFCKIVAKPTIPTNIDVAFTPSFQGREILFCNEIALYNEDLKTIYRDNKVRIIILKIENTDFLETYLYNYSPENNWEALFVGGCMEDIDNLGEIDDYIYELAIGEKGIFSKRGVSVVA